MNLLESVSSKLTIKKMGIHLANYAALYSKPLKIWKNVIAKRKDGYNLIILHLLYYCIFIFFIVKEVTLAIPITILEAAITIIPFLFFLLPFLFYTKIFKKQYKWNKLFRLFLIIKLQFIPPLILSFLLSEKIRVENLYILNDNFIWLIWLSFIIIFPAIISVPFWKKLLWIFTNYIFFLIGVTILAFAVDKIDRTGKMSNKLSIESPNAEYLAFQLRELYSPQLFDDNYYFVLTKAQNDSNFSILKTQFVSFDLHQSFMQSQINELASEIKHIDSLTTLYNKKFKDSLPTHRKEVGSKTESYRELTLGLLDTLRTELNTKFYSLLKESNKLKDSAKFESNRDYFYVLTNYLQAYEKSYSDHTEINKILSTSTLDGTIKYDSTIYGALFKIDSNYYNSTKSKLMAIESNFVKRSNRSTFIFNILFYPEEVILDKLGYFDR